MMGGLGAHEYMAPCPAGENEVALAPGYAANVEVARADAQPVELPAPLAAPEEVATPGADDDRRRRRPARRARGRALKAFPVVTERARAACSCSSAATTASTRSSSPTRSASRSAPRTRRDRRPHRPARLHRPGRRRRAGAPRRGGRARRRYVTGANRDGRHLRGVEPGRDFGSSPPTSAASRRATRSTGNAIRIEPAIEIGNIFKLGTRYSDPLNATVLDESGPGAHARHGLLRHRPGAHPRRRRRAVRRRAGHLLAALARAVGRRARRARQAGHRGARARRAALRRARARRASRCSTTTATPARARSSPTPSSSACPLRLTVGRRTISGGEVEAQVRRGRETRALPLDDDGRGGGGAVENAGLKRDGASAAALGEAAADVPAALRAGPLGPAAARRRSQGAPLNPWTIPNAIGFLRLALIPVFLVVALSSRRRDRRAGPRSCSR